MEAITGSAAGVPYTALPPAGGTDTTAPLIVTWHMLDAPRTDAAFAAALPMAEVPAWRVHLGMPMCGARIVNGRPDAVLALIFEDSLMAYAAPFTRQAAAEFPAALAALREQLPVDDGPIGLLGASLGGSVALHVLATQQIPVKAVALVNPGIRARSTVGVIEAFTSQPYQWSTRSHQTADDLDFVAHAADITAQPPVLLVSGEQDHAAFKTDAADFVHTLRARYPQPDDVELITVPNMAHPLADEPGLEPAPQLTAARKVDAILTTWFTGQYSAP